MITAFKPRSKALEKYVDCFYVFNQDGQNISYIAFPHTNTGLSFFKDTQIKRVREQVIIESASEKHNSVTIEILGKYVNPLVVHYSGKIQEVAIVFKPLGINHFLNTPLSQTTPFYSQNFKNDAWLNFGEALFKETSVKSQIPALENFLLRQLQDIDLALMYKATNYLATMESEYSIKRIAALLNMNLKTFQRRFYKNLACSPSDYRRIAKFRYSVNIGLMEKEIKKLTAIAYDSNYYDQSYFIREYKKLTRLSPKTFFTTITSFADNNIVWKIK